MVVREYDSPLGKIMMASDGVSLKGLWLEGQMYFAQGMKMYEVVEVDEVSETTGGEPLVVFEETKRWLDLYFEGKCPDFLPPLAPEGTEFRRRVWDILLTIPYGKTMTYGEIAGIIARERGVSRMSAQAVGGAVGHNPISILIPCHRVVGSDGSLTGYAGGVDKKAWLLELERTVF